MQIVSLSPKCQTFFKGKIWKYSQSAIYCISPENAEA